MKSAPIRAGSPRKSRRWSRPRVFGYALLAAVPLGLIAAWVGSSLVGSGTLRRAQAEADRLDPGWRFGDLLARRPVVPDEENGALQVLAALARMRGDFPTPPKIKRSPTGVPIPNPASPLLERLEKVPAWDRLDDRLASALRRELRLVDPAVVEARKLSRMPRGRQDPKYARILWATLLPHVQNKRSVARLLHGDSAIRAQDGDADGAVESALACINVGRSIGDDPIIISQLVRTACVVRGLSSLERALNQGGPSDAALARVQAILLDEAEQPLLLLGLRGERAMIDSIFSQLAIGEVSYKEVMGTGGANAPDPAAEILVSASAAFVRYNHGLALARMNEAVEIARRPAHEQPALWSDWQKRSAPSDSLVARISSSLSRETLPSVGAFSNANLRYRAQLLAMATLLAAERHRLEHGAFPGTIADIDPRFLPRGLIDPFSGGPLRVKSDGEGGLVVYSPGLDGLDDGGLNLDLKKWTQKGYDVGYRLRAPKLRARPPKLATLPEDVFPYDPKADDESSSP